MILEAKKLAREQEGTGLKILTPNQMLKRLPIALAQVKAGKWLDDIESIDEEFIKEYNEISDKGYVIEAYVDYPHELHDLHSDMPFLPERMVINKTKKLVCNLHNEKNYVAHINVLKQALDHGLKLRKVHRVILIIYRVY